MTTFLALYRGHTVAQAKMVADTADPELVALVATHLLKTQQYEENSEDPVLVVLGHGRQKALYRIKQEADHERG